jgi:imidazole glycerol-phosphate synthase subunit HisH
METWGDPFCAQGMSKQRLLFRLGEILSNRKEQSDLEMTHVHRGAYPNPRNRTRIDSADFGCDDPLPSGARKMIAIIDYRAGNLTSVMLAMETIRAEAQITSDPAVVRSADHIIFPGVGAAGAAMRTLIELGLAEVVREVVACGIPFLGICLGTQIILERSEEDGGVQCVGLLPGSVRHFRPPNRRDKVPQMGWNSIRIVRPHPVLEGIEDGSEYYFVHSYYPAPTERGHVVAETDYADVAFASVLAHGSLIATQFHPEKSGKVGLHLLKNFVNWNGRP